MNPIVSVIVTTKNEAKNIKACLESITTQSYKNIEIIVVDNNSKDDTKKISQNYTKLVYNKGPERSAQRNFGAEKSSGEYVFFLDADMKLTKNVVKECVELINQKKVGGIIIPEESYGVGFWADCKKLERSFYIGNDSIEAARFFNKNIFIKSGGFDEQLTGPEDWDLSQKIKEKFGISRIKSNILHNEGKLTLHNTLKKKYYYSKKFKTYLEKKSNTKYTSKQFNILSRYKIFFSNPKKLFSNPILGLGMLFMKTTEFIIGGVGFIVSKKYEKI